MGCLLTTIQFRNLPSTLRYIDLDFNQISSIDIVGVPPALRTLNLRNQKCNETFALHQRLQRVHFIHPLPDGLRVKLQGNGPIDVDYDGGIVSVHSPFFLYHFFIEETVRWDDGSEIFVDRDRDFMDHDTMNQYQFLGDADEQFGDKHLGLGWIVGMWVAVIFCITMMICSWKVCRSSMRANN